MGGPPAAMKVEATFTELLAKVTRWKVDDKTLVLSDGTADMEMRFKIPAAGKASPLTGTEWTLQGFEKTEGEAVSFTTPVEGTTITLSIAADGPASGSAGVNRYFGKVEPGKAGKITFGRMVSTHRGGPPKAMAQERDYLKQLAAVASWRVTGKRLVLTDADRSFALIYESK
jgi:heat shock protein HslJ